MINCLDFLTVPAFWSISIGLWIGCGLALFYYAFSKNIYTEPCKILGAAWVLLSVPTCLFAAKDIIEKVNGEWFTVIGVGVAFALALLAVPVSKS